MKISVKIPDWAVGMPVYVIAGKELLAYRQPLIRHEKDGHVVVYGPKLIKTERCNGCGQCCKGCIFLRYDGCAFKEQIPLSCVTSDCSKSFPDCSERFKANGLDD